MKYFIKIRLIITVCSFFIAISLTSSQALSIKPALKEKIEKAVVYISVITESGEKKGGGTVVHIGDGKVYVLTAFHVIEGYESVAVQFFGQDEKVPVPDEYIKVDRTYDLALLKVPTTHPVRDVPFLRADLFNKEVIASAPVWMLIPRGDGRRDYRSGYISNRTTTTISFPIQVQRGWSGSPLLNENGFLIGILVEEEGRFYTGKAVRGDKVKEVILDRWPEVFEKQKIIIKAFPHADVSIDGGFIGEVPPARTQEIEVGIHTIEFVSKTLDRRYTVEVEIEAGVSREIRMNMITGGHEVKDLI